MFQRLRSRFHIAQSAWHRRPMRSKLCREISEIEPAHITEISRASDACQREPSGCSQKVRLF
jgi:hypothetical protein